MRTFVLLLALVALFAFPSMAKPKAKACSEDQGWVVIEKNDTMIPELVADAQLKGPAQFDASCQYRKTVLQKACYFSTDAAKYQYRAKSMARCPGKKEGKKKMVNVFFVGDYTKPATP